MSFVQRLQCMAAWALIVAASLACIAAVFTVGIYLIDWHWLGWGLTRSFAFCGAFIGLVAGGLVTSGSTKETTP